MATKTKKVKKVSAKADIKASIRILGKIYKSSGGSVREALENFKPVGKVAGSSILTISNGSVCKDKVLTHVQTFRLFSASKLMREIAIKNTSLLFDNL